MIVGCARQTRLVLEQRQAPPAQRHIELASQWAFESPADGGREIVLHFPLPGSENGPRDFHVFVWMPDAVGETVIGGSGPDQARGFLIQDVGGRKGKTEFTSGTVTLIGERAWLRRGRRRVHLDVVCDDGTRIVSDALVRADSREISLFNTDFSSDIAVLRDEATPAENPTDRRPGGAP